MLRRKKFLRFFLAGILSTVSNPMFATSIVLPKFSQPIIEKDRLVCTSPDSKRLICVGIDGTKHWEKSYSEPVRLIPGPDSEPLLQTGKVVNALVLQSGEMQPRFVAESETDEVSYFEEGGAFISNDRRFKERIFKLLDDKTGKPIWRSKDVERLLFMTPEIIATVTSERIPSGSGYRFGWVSLEGFDRKSFGKKWSVPLMEKENSPYVPSALKGSHLVYVDGRSSLSVVDIASGRKLVSKTMELPKHGRISDVEINEDMVVWLTHEMNLQDFNQTKHTLHFCTLPELVERKTVTLKLIEIAKISFEGGFIISDALYRTACFRMNGDKVWERFQSNRTKQIGGRIFFSDYHDKSARLGYVDVSTGKETILYSEPVN